MLRLYKYASVYSYFCRFIRIFVVKINIYTIMTVKDYLEECESLCLVEFLKYSQEEVETLMGCKTKYNTDEHEQIDNLIRFIKNSMFYVIHEGKAIPATAEPYELPKFALLYEGIKDNSITKS